MVRFASLFDVKERTVTFLSGKKYSVEMLCSMGAGDLLNSMLDFSEKLRALDLSEEEMSLFTAVVLVSAGTVHILLQINNTWMHPCMYMTSEMQRIILIIYYVIIYSGCTSWVEGLIPASGMLGIKFACSFRV